MKKILSLCLLLVAYILPHPVHAQRTADVGYSSGVVNFVGDLANEKYFPFSSLSTGMAVTLRNFMNNPRHSGTTTRPFDMQLRLSWHRLQYDETNAVNGKKGKDLRNYMRGLNFRNDLFGAEADITYNIYLNKYSPLWKPKWTIFFLTGIGAFYGQPKADLFHGSAEYGNRYYYWSDGSIRNIEENTKNPGKVIEKDGKYETSLRDWNTEGQGYNNEVHNKKPYSFTNVGIPFGSGVRYIYNKYLTVSAEMNYYFFLTDYLDDASGRYATYEELKASFPDPEKFEMAKYISDPTGHGTNGYIGTPTSKRGNPNLKDAFTYVSLEVAYKFVWKRKGIYGQ